MPIPAIIASLLSAYALSAAIWLVVPPPRRLRARVQPYLRPTANQLSKTQVGPIGAVFGPMLADLSARLGRILDRDGSIGELRLRQARWFVLEGDGDPLAAYRMRQLRSLGIGALAGLGIGLALRGSLLLVAALGVLGSVAAVGRLRGRIDSAIETRRELMRVEIYTINQLLAMRVRAGSGVVRAVAAIVERATGEVVEELSEALRLHRSGWRAADAFRQVADTTPEPVCARTYRLLATADERGADLAGALLALSEDVREMRRESVKRAATKRRSAMLFPTIAILAPVLILFVAAPLPYLITGWQ